MKYADRARRVIEEIAALPSTRPSDGDPEKLKILVNGVLSGAKYEWEQIDKNLFPDGKPLSLDLKDPALALQWKTIRQNQRDLVEEAVRTQWRPNPKSGDMFVYDKDGFSFRIDLLQLYNTDAPIIDGQEVAKIAVRYFGDFFALISNGRQLRLSFSMPDISGMPEALYLQWKMREAVYSALGGHVYGTSDLSNDTFPQQMIHACNEVINIDAMHLLRDHSRQWRAMQRHRAKATTPVKSKDSLADFLQRRLDKARLRLEPVSALDQFNALPILGQRAKNAKTGRTWGIELEVIDAGAIAYDAAGGWKRERDGSLRQQIGDGRIYDPWEFISPVLSKTYDDGLWMICDQAKNTVKYYKAGVHVHVSAVSAARKVYDPATKKTTLQPGQTMTTAQVSRLIELYATMSPLLDPIIQRTKTREFCVPTKVDQWANGWFEAPTSKKPHRMKPLRDRKQDAIENARIWAQITHGPNHDAETTEWKRHQELNLQSLNKYGTIEFRSMAAIYDYEYLTRWAWLCRAMVDYAQSDEPIGAIYKVTDFNSLVALLHRATAEPIIKAKAARRAA